MSNVGKMELKSGLVFYYDLDIIKALTSGKIVQYKPKNQINWREYDAQHEQLFGPWHYDQMYEWRVKPATVKLKIAVEIFVDAEIPTPISNDTEVIDNADYFLVTKEEGFVVEYNNYSRSNLVQDMPYGYIYLNKEDAEECSKIIKQTKGLK